MEKLEDHLNLRKSTNKGSENWTKTLQKKELFIRLLMKLVNNRLNDYIRQNILNYKQNTS
jgi:hypothetical protein